MSQYNTSYGKGVDLCLSWLTAFGSEIPAGAVHIGDDRYVARCVYNDEMTPGKVAAGHSSCYVSHGGEEHTVEMYQVLCDTCTHNLAGNGWQWVPWSGDSVPKNALIGGTSDGTPLYVARAQVEGEWCAGKFWPNAGIAYFPFDGAEHELTDGFEVLTMCKRSG